MNRTTITPTALLGALLLAAIPVGCGAGDDVAPAEPTVRHPLAVVLRDARASMQPLDGSDADGLDAFLRYGKPGASSYEVRRACELAGKALRGASPAVLAEVVLRGRDHLHDTFFKALDDAKLAAIASRIATAGGPGEIDRLRMEAIIRRGSAVYEGPLGRALGVVPFNEAVAPRPLPLTDLLPGNDEPVEAWVGAGEILRLSEFVREGDQRDLAADTFRRALVKWPGHPLLVAGLVSLYVENEDRYADELADCLEQATRLDPDNAAWPYLAAARAFRTGKDAIGLAALREGRERSVLTFRSLERARAAAAYLEAKGYGPARARLTAYRSVSMAGWFLLKDLANRAVGRSYEFETSKRDEELYLVLELPRQIDRQMKAAPRTVFADLLRGTMLATGLARQAEYQRTRNPALAEELGDQARAEEDWCTAVETASQEYAGQDAWTRFYDALGEEGFLGYLDGVLFADEASFLLACRKEGDFGRALELARRER